MHTLIETLLSGSELESRKQAARELGQLEELPREAVEALRACLRADEHELVEAAAFALVQHDFVSELHKLLDEFYGHKPGLARRMVRRTLDRDVESVPELVELLGGSNLEALLASELLAEQGDAVVPIMVELIERNVDSTDGDDGWWNAQSVMYWAGRVLRRLGPRAVAAAPTLCKVFTHGQPYRDTTYQATRALEAMGASIIPILLDSPERELIAELIENLRSRFGAGSLPDV
jgi:hypothetical protein